MIFFLVIQCFCKKKIYIYIYKIILRDTTNNNNKKKNSAKKNSIKCTKD